MHSLIEGCNVHFPHLAAGMQVLQGCRKFESVLSRQTRRGCTVRRIGQAPPLHLPRVTQPATTACLLPCCREAYFCCWPAAPALGRPSVLRRPDRREAASNVLLQPRHVGLRRAAAVAAELIFQQRLLVRERVVEAASLCTWVGGWVGGALMYRAAPTDQRTTTAPPRAIAGASNLPSSSAHKCGASKVGGQTPKGSGQTSVADLAQLAQHPLSIQEEGGGEGLPCSRVGSKQSNLKQPDGVKAACPAAGTMAAWGMAFSWTTVGCCVLAKSPRNWPATHSASCSSAPASRNPGVGERQRQARVGQGSKRKAGKRRAGPLASGQYSN